MRVYTRDEGNTLIGDLGLGLYRCEHEFYYIFLSKTPIQNSDDVITLDVFAGIKLRHNFRGVLGVRVSH